MEKKKTGPPLKKKKTPLFSNEVPLGLVPELSYELWATPVPWDGDSSDIAVVSCALGNEWQHRRWREWAGALSGRPLESTAVDGGGKRQEWAAEVRL
jgi:hypothetical protein